VPFVAVRFSIASPEKRFYWGFWFRNEQERDQCYQESPKGQWLATGHRPTIRSIMKEAENDQDNLLFAQDYGGKNTVSYDLT
jgi:hypothetical protein